MFLIIVFIFAAVFIGFAARAHQRRIAERLPVWMAATEELGIPAQAEVMRKKWQFEGPVDGLRVKARRFETDSGTYVDLSVTYPTLGLGLKLREEKSFHQGLKVVPFLGGALQAADVEVGDSAFDDKFLVTGTNSVQVEAFLTEARRLALLRLQSTFRGVRVSDTEIKWRLTGDPKSPSHLVSPIRHVVATAHVLLGTDPALEAAVDAVAAGDLAEGLKNLDAVEGPAAAEAHLLEAELLASGAGSLSEARDVVRQLDAEVVNDPELAVLHSHVDAGDVAPLPTPESLAVPRHDGQAQLDQLTDLFGHSPHESRALFDAQYQGQTVAWMGVVRRFRNYANDLDFGDGPGIKMMAGIGHVETDYGRVEVDAVVALPADTPLAEGDEIFFQGTVLKMDGFTRNVFIANAQLLENRG